MPPPLIVDLARIDLSVVVADREEIRKTVPQRFEMEQLDAVHHLDREARIAVGSRRIREDEWWVRGHIPGRPIFPGVLTIEAAAQLSTWLFKAVFADPRFFGFGALDQVRFRGRVEPGDTLVLLARITEVRSRSTVIECQATVRGRLVFQGIVTGLAV
jgi:3-hydroxyacyl-[acyl-carrier-protein] dehydratase